MLTSPPPESPTTAKGIAEESIDIQQLYNSRFEKNRAAKDAVWRILCAFFFQKFVPEDAVVIDIAAGNAEFINHIRAKEKIAFDINPDIMKYAQRDVRAIQDSFFVMDKYLNKECDIIFASNVLEHLDNKEQVIAALRICHKQLAAGGRLLILQPNIKYVKGAYWDFIDHKIALTDKSLIEAGMLCGFKVVYKRARFLPYTTQSSIPQHPFLVLLYLTFPPIQLILGKQSFIILEKI